MLASCNTHRESLKGRILGSEFLILLLIHNNNFEIGQVFLSLNGRARCLIFLERECQKVLFFVEFFLKFFRIQFQLWKIYGNHF